MLLACIAQFSINWIVKPYISEDVAFLGTTT